MSSPIDGYISQIRNAVYGKDVRSAIADGISQCYTDVAAGVTRADAAAQTITGTWNATASPVGAGQSPTASVEIINGTINLQFGIPKGDKGDTGSKGDTGATGPQGPQGAVPIFTIGTVTALENGNATASINSSDPLHPTLSLGLPKGNTGTTPSFNINGVETLENYEDAYVSIDPESDPENIILNFGIPKGPPGTITNVTGENINISGSSQKSIKQYIDESDSTLSAQISSLSNLISEETTNRISGDAGLTSRISALEGVVLNLGCISITFPAVSSFPATFSDPRITANSIVISHEFGNPSVVNGNITWSTSSGTISLSSTSGLSGSTSITLYLVNLTT